MPVFTDALIGDTMHLSPEEFGAYCLILFATWRNNGKPLPDDGSRLSRICRVSETRWRTRIRPVLVGFFDVSEGTWRQKRLEKEWRFVEEMRTKNSEAGKASAEAKRLKKQETESTPVPPVLQPNVNPHTLKEEVSKEGSVGLRNPTAESSASASFVAVAGEEHKPPQQSPPDPKKELYTLGKEVLGKSAGGQITKLIALHEGDLKAAMYTMRQVANAAYPPEYLGKILSKETQAPTDWDAEYASIGIRADRNWVPFHERPGDDGVTRH